jgi:hypothetical protein
MATINLPFNVAMSQVMDPRNNPYFGTFAPNGNPNRMGYTQGSGNGLGVFDWQALAELGYDTSMFAPEQMNGDASPAGLDPNATADWLASNGLQLRQAPDAGGNIYRYMTDDAGNIVGDPQFFGTDDDAFLAAALAAAGITGANIWAAGIGSGAGAVAGLGEAAAPTVATGSSAAGGATAFPVSPGSVLSTPLSSAPSLGQVASTAVGPGINFGSGATSALYPGTAAASTATAASGLGPIGNVVSSLLPNSLGGWGQLASSLYGIYQGNKMLDMAQNADPFAPYRGGYAAQLQQLMTNPNIVTGLPGYQATMASAEQALTRNLASQGLTGSGAAAEALAKFGGEFQNQAFSQYLSQLAGLAGAGSTGSAGLMEGSAAGYNTINQSLNNLFKIQPRG